jgi:hypothetical protein
MHYFVAPFLASFTTHRSFLDFVNLAVQQTLYNPVQLMWMLDNPDQNMKNEKCCSHLSTYFKRHLEFWKANKSL